MSEEKVNKNTVGTSMRQTCKNHPKNEQKTHQKSSKNRLKKHTEKLTTQFQPKVRELWPKGAQKLAASGERGDPGWNPPRKKKEYCKNQTYCGERVHAGRKHADCDRISTRPCGGPHTARGRIFVVDFGTLWAPIWLLLAPFWHPLAPCWVPLARFGNLWGAFR